MKLLVAFATVILSFILFGTEWIESKLIQNQSFGWFTVYLVPRVLFTVTLFLLAGKLFHNLNLKFRFRLMIVLGIFCSGIGLYLLINTPYKVDWNAEGAPLSNDPDAQPYESYFEKDSPNHNGVACVVLAGCDYCHGVLDDLVKMKTRQPDLNVTVFVFSIDSSEILQVKNQIGDAGIAVTRAPGPDASFRITDGNFPTVLYIKDGKVVHKWFFDQFGYPAKDLIESRRFINN